MTYTRSSLHAYTYKDGVLARVAHDLRLVLPEFEVSATGDGAHLAITFDLRSLRPEGAMVGGLFSPGELGAKELREIAQTIHDEVLDTRRFPQARFVGALERQAQGAIARGRLELHGKVAPLVLVARREARAQGERFSGELELRPSDFGIAPYRALLGALKLQDRVRIEFSIDPSELAQS